MTLPAADSQYLADRDLTHEVALESGAICVLLSDWPLPAGYTPGARDLLLRLSPAYPDAGPDMWWFSPAVIRVDGRVIPGTESQEYHLGRTWQRWSRHFNAGQWLASVDGLESYLALVAKELRRCAQEDL